MIDRIRTWLRRRGVEPRQGQELLRRGVDVTREQLGRLGDSSEVPPDFEVADPDAVRSIATSAAEVSRRNVAGVAQVARLGLDGRPAPWSELTREPGSDERQVTVYLPGRLLVGEGDVERVRERVDARVRVHELATQGIVRLDFPADAADPLALAGELREAGIEAAPDHLVLLAPVYRFGPGTDPVPDAEPHDDKPYEPSGRVRVTVLDTGCYDAATPPVGGTLSSPRPPWLDAQQPVAPEHRDVLDVDGDRYLDAYAGHGTFAADVVAELAPCAELVVHKVGQADGVIAESALADAIERWRATLSPERAELLNLSLGVYANPLQPLALRRQLELLSAQVERERLDVLVVAAAGNDNVDTPFYPAAWGPGHDVLTSVGALDAKDRRRRAAYSNFGEWVEVWAPGTHLAFYPPGVFRYADGTTMARFRAAAATWSGTSFATPHVAGLVARALCEDAGRDRTAAEVLAGLLADGVEVQDAGGPGRAVGEPGRAVGEPGRAVGESGRAVGR